MVFALKFMLKDKETYLPVLTKDVDKEYKSYVVSGQFSFNYNSKGIIEVGEVKPSEGWYIVWSSQNSKDKIDNKDTEYVSYNTEGNTAGDEMSSSPFGTQTFGKNIYNVRKVQNDVNDSPIFEYSLVLPDKRTILIRPSHGLNVPMTIDLASVKFE